MTIINCTTLESLSKALTSGDARYGIVFRSPDTEGKYRDILNRFSDNEQRVALFAEQPDRDMAKVFGVPNLPVCIEFNSDAKTLEVLVSGDITFEKMRELVVDRISSEEISMKGTH